jgi:hypothetical protein
MVDVPEFLEVTPKAYKDLLQCLIYNRRKHVLLM